MSLETLIKERTITVSDTKSSISRIAQSFKFDAIRDYNKAHKDLYGKEITIEQFDKLLSLSNAQLQAETDILVLRAEINDQF